MTRHRTVLAELIRQALGGRPRQAVDHEREPRLQLDEDFARIVGAHDVAQLRRRQARPLGDDEHPVRRDGAARRVDDERAGHLAERHRRPHRRRPVVIGAGAAGRELAPGGFRRRAPPAARRARRRARRARGRAASHRDRCGSRRRSSSPPPPGSSAPARSGPTRFRRALRSTGPDLTALRAARSRGRRAASASACRDRACPPDGGCHWPRRSGDGRIRERRRHGGGGDGPCRHGEADEARDDQCAETGIHLDTCGESSVAAPPRVS